MNVYEIVSAVIKQKSLQDLVHTEILVSVVLDNILINELINLFSDIQASNS